jgi:hypothetical protein
MTVGRDEARVINPTLVETIKGDCIAMLPTTSKLKAVIELAQLMTFTPTLTCKPP